MARAIDSEVAYRFLSEQLVKETGAFSKGVNKGLNIARSAMRNPDAIPTLTPPNEPLTLEHLREMDGEPVWVVPKGMHEKDEPMWCVLESSMALIPGVDYWSWDFDGYGETWIAYHRPPEGGDADRG